jgi:hypothetical protein
MRRSVTAALGRVLLLAACAAFPATASAQLGPPGGGIVRGWSPMIAARGGWMLKDQSPSLGAELVVPIPIPLLRGLTVAVSADGLFQNGLVERQAMADATINVFPGLFAGGGPAVMDTYFEDSPNLRDTRNGFTLVAGTRSRMGAVTTTLQARKMWVDSRKPTILMLSIGYPLRGLFGG